MSEVRTIKGLLLEARLADYENQVLASETIENMYEDQSLTIRQQAEEIRVLRHELNATLDVYVELPLRNKIRDLIEETIEAAKGKIK